MVHGTFREFFDVFWMFHPKTVTSAGLFQLNALIDSNSTLVGGFNPFEKY